MALRPEASLGIGLATAGVVFGVFSQATPSIADIRVANPNDEHIASAEQTATWTSAILVSGISLVAKDPTIFIIGAGMIVFMAWYTRHANAVNPNTGQASMENNVQQLTVVDGSEDLAADF